MIDTENLVELYLDGFPTDSESYARWFVNSTQQNNRLTLEVDGKTVCAGYIVEKPAIIFGRKTILPYLSALSTLTPYRGQGLIGKLITNAFDVLIKRGYDVVALSPFSDYYYKRFGFATISNSATKIIEGGESYSMRDYTDQDQKSFMEAYNAMTTPFDNYLKVDEAFIKSKLDEYAADNIKCKVISDGNEDFAFVFMGDSDIEFYGGDANKLHKTEILKGYKYTVFGEYEDVMIQARILCVQSVLSKCLYQEENKCRSMRIKDDIITKNNIEGVLYCSKREFVQQKVTQEEIDIASLTQKIYVGDNDCFKSQINFFCDKY